MNTSCEERIDQSLGGTPTDLLGEVYRLANLPEFVKGGRRRRLTADERADVFREVAYGLAVARRALGALAEAEDVEFLREFYGRSWTLLLQLSGEVQKRNRAAD